MNKALIYIFFVLIITFYLTSCYSKPDFSNTPSIGFVDIDVVEISNSGGVITDSISITISYKDGDGNLGLSGDIPEDSRAPYQSTKIENCRQEGGETVCDTVPNEFHFNYRLTPLIQDGDNFVPLSNSITDGFWGRFPRLFEDNKRNPLEGTIIRDTKLFHFPGSFIPPNSIIKFQVQILDRELNESNIIETDTIRVNVQ